jgi:hypothetical protein
MQRLESGALSTPGVMSDHELTGLDEPVVRYFRAAIAPGTPLATGARLRISGRIRVGRWLPFTSTETLVPLAGFHWAARVAGGVMSGGDYYAAGVAHLDWRLLGVIGLIRASGADVARSAAARAGGEGLWVPTALLPRFGVRWTAESDSVLRAEFAVDDTPLDVRYELDAHARVRSVTFPRWGDPDRSGEFGWHIAGGEITAHRTFGGLTIPSEGRFGWHYGTPGWSRGEFFRYRITGLQPLAHADTAAGAAILAR